MLEIYFLLIILLRDIEFRSTDIILKYDILNLKVMIMIKNLLKFLVLQNDFEIFNIYYEWNQEIYQ